MAKAAITVGVEVTRIALGRSQAAPAKGDWRFKDATWCTNALYRRIAQTYLATCGADAVTRRLVGRDLSQDWGGGGGDPTRIVPWGEDG